MVCMAVHQTMKIYKGRLDLCMYVSASANILRRKFYYCSDYIKIMLFKSYCSRPMYGLSLWCNFSKSVFSGLSDI